MLLQRFFSGYDRTAANEIKELSTLKSTLTCIFGLIHIDIEASGLHKFVSAHHWSFEKRHLIASRHRGAFHQSLVLARCSIHNSIATTLLILFVYAPIGVRNLESVVMLIAKVETTVLLRKERWLIVFVCRKLGTELRKQVWSTHSISKIKLWLC